MKKRLPRKIKKQRTPKRIPMRWKDTPATFYDFLLKKDGRPFCDMKSDHKSKVALYKFLADEIRPFIK